MAAGWDLFVLDPLLVVVGISILSFIVVRERTSLKWVWYFLSTLLFWFVTAIIVSMNTIQLQLAQVNEIFTNPIWMMLLFLGSSTLVSIIFKPLATWLTGKSHWRKWWIFLALITLSFSLIFTIANQQVNSAFLYILVALTLGFGLSANSLFFLTFNEQFYYRIAPVLSSVLISIVISFATFFGTYLTQLEANFFATKNGYLVLTSILGFAGLVAFGVIQTIFKEDHTYVKSFELSQIKKLPKYNHLRLVYLAIAVFLLGAFFGLTQSVLTTDYLKSYFYAETSKFWPDTQAMIRVFNQLFIVPQFLFGYWIYKQVNLKFGFKPTLIGSLSICLFVILLITFLDNPFAYVILNFILGLTFSQLFYAFFGMAMMWNYRAKNIPVTGIVASSSAFGFFIVQTIIQIIKTNKVGIYAVDYLEDPVKFSQIASPVVVIYYGVAGAFCIASIVALFFSMQYVFADFMNLNMANQFAKTLLKDAQREKSRNRILLNDVKVVER